MPPETPGVNPQLPPITEETMTRVIEELGMDRDVVAGQPLPADKRHEMAVNIFGTFVQINRPLVEIIQRVLAENIYAVSPAYRNAAIAGMGTVIRAYDIGESFGLLQRLRLIQGEDLTKVESILKTVFEGRNKRDLLENLLQIQVIPELEINLNTIIDRGANSSGLGASEYRDGATVMYRVLAEFSSKLFPPRGPAAPMPPPPTGISPA